MTLPPLSRACRLASICSSYNHSQSPVKCDTSNSKGSQFSVFIVSRAFVVANSRPGSKSVPGINGTRKGASVDDFQLEGASTAISGCRRGVAGESHRIVQGAPSAMKLIHAPTVRSEQSRHRPSNCSSIPLSLGTISNRAAPLSFNT